MWDSIGNSIEVIARTDGFCKFSIVSSGGFVWVSFIEREIVHIYFQTPWRAHWTLILRDHLSHNQILSLCVSKNAESTVKCNTCCSNNIQGRTRDNLEDIQFYPLSFGFVGKLRQ